MADLRIDDLHVDYGGVRALRGVSLRVPHGGCVCVLGANGAGKTTLMKAGSGLVPYTGRILLDGTEVAGAPERIARQGLGHVLEGRHVFVNMTVKENLLVGRFGRRERGGDERLAFLLDAFPVLKLKLKRLGGQLSGGEQQTVAIARSLMAEPKVLLMDEPSLGLSPVVIDQLSSALVRLREELQTTLLVAEQSIALALEIGSYFYVLRQGEVSYEGPGDLSVLWEQVHRAYLGGRAGTPT